MVISAREPSRSPGHPDADDGDYSDDVEGATVAATADGVGHL